MIDTQAVKIKILNLAMRGQLTEQIPEESAEELYDEIIKEKARLVKEGRIKKEKPLGDISNEDAPFESPANWKWVYFGEIFSHNTGKALNASDNEGNLLEYITTSNMYWDHFELDNLKKMYFKDDEIEKCTIKKGDLLICEGGDIGRSAIWDFPYEMRIQNHIHKLRPYLSSLSPIFYYYVMMLYKASNLINGQGIGLQGFSSKRVHTLVVPLPPASEQTRIVQRIEEVFEILDKIDTLQDQYASNQEALKSKLVDAAIQGKLTEQLPEDGTAEELYQKIQEVKRSLVKEGKIKKEKPLPEASEDEIPFEIPSNWRWVRVSEVIDVRDGTHDSPKYHNEGIPLVTSKNISGGKLSFDDVKLISALDAQKINERSYVDDGDILFAMIGSIGNPVIVHKDRDFCIKNVALFKNFAPMHISMDYFYWFLMHEQYVLRKNAIGGLQPFVSLKVFRNHLMPLPPISEQIRIADRLYELMDTVSE